MEQWQKDHIRKNLRQLVEGTSCGALFLDSLVEAGVLNDEDIDELSTFRNKLERSSELYLIIQSRKDAYHPLIGALRVTNQSGPANLLEKAYEEQAEPTKSREPSHNDAIAMEEPTTIPDFPSSNPHKDAPTEGIEVDFVNNVEPLMVSVTKPETQMEFEDDHYGLPAESKGYALVLNITDFGNTEQNRTGSQMDTIYMSQLWSALGYKVTVQQGFFTSPQIHSILDSFAAKFEEDPSASSSVVFIGSHGSFSRIESSDHEPINLYSDVIYKFDSSQCPQLLGKPKIFIIQACQRFKQESPPEMMPMGLQAPIDDTVICYSTIPGYVANRDVFLGTWYVYCLTKVFMEEAHQTHLFRLLKKTQEAMRNINADADQGQMSAYMDFGIKMLYFNMSPD